MMLVVKPLHLLLNCAYRLVDLGPVRAYLGLALSRSNCQKGVSCKTTNLACCLKSFLFFFYAFPSVF